MLFVAHMQTQATIICSLWIWSYQWYQRRVFLKKSDNMSDVQQYWEWSETKSYWESKHDFNFGHCSQCENMPSVEQTDTVLFETLHLLFLLKQLTILHQGIVIRSVITTEECIISLFAFSFKQDYIIVPLAPCGNWIWTPILHKVDFLGTDERWNV